MAQNKYTGLIQTVLSVLSVIFVVIAVIYGQGRDSTKVDTLAVEVRLNKDTTDKNIADIITLMKKEHEEYRQDKKDQSKINIELISVLSKIETKLNAME